ALAPRDYLDAAEPYAHHQDQSFQFKIDVFFRSMLGTLARTGAALLVSNQLREKVGVMFGSPETVPWATLPIYDYASIRVKVERLNPVKDGEVPIGAECRVKVVKSRLAAPLQQAEFKLLFASGISLADDLLTLGTKAGVLQKRSNGVYLDSRHLGSGR